MEMITKDQQCEVHPAAEIFPRMAAQAFEDLKADIRDKGVLEPVWVDEEGRLLDGRHRVRACQELGIDTRYEVYEGDDPIGFVISRNCHRRHMNETERAVSAARASTMTLDTPAGPLQICSMSIDEAAQAMGVSVRLVYSAAKVLKHAVPELLAEVEAGRVRISAAEEVVELTEAEQVALAVAGPEAVKTRAAELRRARTARGCEQKATSQEADGTVVCPPALTESGPDEGPKRAPREEMEATTEADIPEHDAAGPDPTGVVDEPTLPMEELPKVTEKHRQPGFCNLSSVADGIDNLWGMPDARIVAQLLYEKEWDVLEHITEAAEWLAKLSRAMDVCFRTKGTPQVKE